MYKMDNQSVNDLVKSFNSIIRSARAVSKNPNESHYRLEEIAKTAQVQLQKIKDSKYRTKATQKMPKPKIN